LRLMLIAQSNKLNYYPSSPGHEYCAPVLLGSTDAAIRLDALSSLIRPRNSNEKVLDLHLLALTDPDQRVRYEAALRLLDATLTGDGCISKTGDLVALAQGCAFEQLVRFCLNPPIAPDMQADARWGKGEKSPYDSQHALLTTRVMVLRVLQSRKDNLGLLGDYVQQEVKRLRPILEALVSADGAFAKGQSGRWPDNNVLRLSLHELPASFNSDTLSPLAQLMMLYLVGYTQSTTWTSLQRARLPYSSILRGCERALADLGELVPELRALSRVLLKPTGQEGVQGPSAISSQSATLREQEKLGVLKRFGRKVRALL
jgi:hypothetical protein